jgi:integrase
VARYERVVPGFLEFLPEAKRAQQLGALSIGDIRRYRDHLLSGGRAETTANMAVKIIRTPLTVARKQGLITSNPAEAVELVTATTNEKGVFSADDVAKMMNVSTEEWKGLILAGYYTGARAGDVSNLKWEALDLKRGTVSFTRQKTKSGIEIPLHPELKRWHQTKRGLALVPSVTPMTVIPAARNPVINPVRPPVLPASGRPTSLGSFARGRKLAAIPAAIAELSATSNSTHIER